MRGIGSMPFSLPWDCWYSFCIQRGHHLLLPYWREGMVGFSRPFELPADVLSADERLFSAITLPSCPGRGKEGICAASLFLFSSIWWGFFVTLWTGSRGQSWKWLLDCPGLYRHLNHLPKSILWKDWLPYVQVKITRLCSNLLISLLFMQQDERKKDPGHLEGWREGELCPADSLPEQHVLSHNCTAQPEEPRAFPSPICRGRELHRGVLLAGQRS